MVLNDRMLNTNTIPDQYPLPRIDELLDSLIGKKIFSIVDATDGFWQVLMELKSRKYTGFIVDGKHYQ